MVPGQSSGFDLTRNYGMARRRSGCTELNEKGWEMLRPQKRLWTGGRRETEEVVVLNKLLSWSSLATDADGWMLCFGAFRGLIQDEKEEEGRGRVLVKGNLIGTAALDDEVSNLTRHRLQPKPKSNHQWTMMDYYCSSSSSGWTE